KALVKLEERGVLDLPKPAKTYAFQQPAVSKEYPPVPELCCSLKELGQISVYPIKSRYSKESKICSALLDRYHYLGSGPICGAQIRYIVKCSQGYLGTLVFSSASYALKCRDSYIGWTDGAKRANLDRVVTNSRFLILPTVRVPHLASHVLSLALARLVQDWQMRYQIRPVLVETFVDPAFAGTCYKAANFVEVGKSAGRRDGKAKRVFLYPLCSRWKEALLPEPDVPMPRPESPKSWAEEEFGTVRFYDNRLKSRLYTIAQDFYDCPEANIPEACSSKARTMAAYRFFQNPKVTMDTVLTPHTEATVERIRDHKLVLVPQDTTSLNYSTHPMTEGLGPIRNARDKTIGLLLHDALAFTEEGTPLGIVDAQCWARSTEERQKSLRRKTLPIEQKESIKWIKSFKKVSKIQKLCPETMLVSMGDRESDIYDLFLEADKKGAAKLLIRAEKGRNRQVEQDFLWDFMAKREIDGFFDIHIPRRGSSPARDARLDIRFAEVNLQPPKGHEKVIKVWAVYVREENGSLNWMLLTTVPVRSFNDART
ncbi:MAG: IS4 family transposase, partial [Dehalococcoidia bacterium]|nr:IS4 family transposase [Dehalococcoidia bacterium]